MAACGTTSYSGQQSALTSLPTPPVAAAGSDVGFSAHAQVESTSGVDGPAPRDEEWASWLPAFQADLGFEVRTGKHWMHFRLDGRLSPPRGARAPRSTDLPPPSRQAGALMPAVVVYQHIHPRIELSLSGSLGVTVSQVRAEGTRRDCEFEPLFSRGGGDCSTRQLPRRSLFIDPALRVARGARIRLAPRWTLFTSLAASTHVYAAKEPTGSLSHRWVAVTALGLEASLSAHASLLAAVSQVFARGSAHYLPAPQVALRVRMPER